MAGIEPATGLGPYGFSYHDGFRRLASRLRAQLVRGLDYPFTVAFAGEAFAVGAARLVSTPARRTFVRRDWLGIAM